MNILYTTSLAVLAALTLNTAHADSYVCNDNVERTTPTSRFVLSGGEALDTKTNLIWSRCLHGKTWSEETSQCEGTATNLNWRDAMNAEPEGWRVPNVKELGSIVEHACGHPSLNLDVFSVAIIPHLWSSTPGRLSLGVDVFTSNTAWSVGFLDGVSRIAQKNQLGRIMRYHVVFVKDAE